MNELFFVMVRFDVPCCNCVLSLSLCGLGGFQHFAILLKYIIHVAIPDIPGWVAEEMAKLEYRRREAFKVLLNHSLKDLRPTQGLLLAALNVQFMSRFLPVYPSVSPGLLICTDPRCTFEAYF